MLVSLIEIFINYKLRAFNLTVKILCSHKNWTHVWRNIFFILLRQSLHHCSVKVYWNNIAVSYNYKQLLPLKFINLLELLNIYQIVLIFNKISEIYCLWTRNWWFTIRYLNKSNSFLVMLLNKFISFAYVTMQSTNIDNSYVYGIISVIFYWHRWGKWICQNEFDLYGYLSCRIYRFVF